MTKPLSAGQYLKSAGFQSGNVSEYALASIVDARADSSGNSLNRKPWSPVKYGDAYTASAANFQASTNASPSWMPWRR